MGEVSVIIVTAGVSLVVGVLVSWVSGLGKYLGAKTVAWLRGRAARRRQARADEAQAKVDAEYEASDEREHDDWTTSLDEPLTPERVRELAPQLERLSTPATLGLIDLTRDQRRGERTRRGFYGLRSLSGARELYDESLVVKTVLHPTSHVGYRLSTPGVELARFVNSPNVSTPENPMEFEKLGTDMDRALEARHCSASREADIPVTG